MMRKLEIIGEAIRQIAELAADRRPRAANTLAVRHNQRRLSQGGIYMPTLR